VNYSPISIAIDGIGLNVTGFSYNGTMWICAVSCREMMPDPARFAECLRSSFEELRDAAASYAAAAADEPALGEDDVAAPARPVRKRKAAGVRPAKAAGPRRARAGAGRTAPSARARRKAAATADAARE
jgi:hypothetical protein